jgi:hypothetical protein
MKQNQEQLYNKICLIKKDRKDLGEDEFNLGMFKDRDYQGEN